MEHFVNLACSMESRHLDWSPLYILSESNISKNVPTSSGAFRLSYKEGDSYYVFFVGESEDLQKELQKYLTEPSNSCISLTVNNSETSCAFRYAKIEELPIRKSTVLQMYKHYQPRCNSIIPKADEEFIVNLQ